MMKNDFCFFLKAFFVLKIFEFLCVYFDDVGKQFDKEGKISFKIYNVIKLQINTTHILPNISRIKGN